MIVKGVITLVLCSVAAWCFPDGAPVDACVKDRPNQPNHGQARSKPLNTMPYRVVASSSHYGPSSAITVTIDGREPFKGFFLQARDAATNEWLGSWTAASNTTLHPECSAITHGDPQHKLRATLVWRAPQGTRSAGTVYFTGTVLKDYGTFWSDLIAEAPINELQ